MENTFENSSLDVVCAYTLQVYNCTYYDIKKCLDISLNISLSIYILFIYYTHILHIFFRCVTYHSKMLVENMNTDLYIRLHIRKACKYNTHIMFLLFC